MVAEGFLLPHFETDDISGLRVNYRASLWQRRYLVLTTPAANGSAASGSNSIRDLRQLAGDDVAVVVSATPIAGVTANTIVIADRWGEVAKVWTIDAANPAPSIQEIGDWVAHVRMRCPECEGEAR